MCNVHITAKLNCLEQGFKNYIQMFLCSIAGIDNTSPNFWNHFIRKSDDKFPAFTT